MRTAVAQATRVALVILAGLTASRAAAAELGTITIPAITFSAQGGGEAEKTGPRPPASQFADGYLHFWYTPGHWIEWTVEDAKAGDYDVALQYTAKLGTARSLSVNGTVAKGLESVVLPRTQRWNDWAEKRLPARITLADGRNVIRMTCLDSASMWLNTMTLSAEGQASRVIKAVQFTGQGGGEVQVLTPATLGYMKEEENRPGEKGQPAEKHWMEWTFDGAAGPYDVLLHYASDSLNLRELRLNGEVVKGLESFALPSTGDDSNWTRRRLPATVTLKKGPNVLRLTNLGGERFRLSSLQLTSPPEQRSEPPARTAEADPPAWPAGKFLAPAPLGPPLPAAAEGAALVQGQTVTLGSRQATVRTIDALPYVENDFSKRFLFDNYDNPKLSYLRQTYHLDQVVAAGRDEFEKQLLLMKWVYEQWDFGFPREMIPEHSALEILKHAGREHKFYCAHSAAVLMAAANSMGWVTRNMAIPRHSFTEIWSNQYQKWILLDATSCYYPERDGVPMNTYEFRQALLRENAARVLHVRPTDAGLDKKPQSPSYGQRLLFIGYLPNTNYMDQGPDYQKFFITKDELTTGKWHTRDCPPNPAADPYFPVNQAAVSLAADGANIKVTLGTLTPNFREFRIRLDGGPWKPLEGTAFTWPLHGGSNRFEAMSVNKFDVAGPVSTVVIELKE